MNGRYCAKISCRLSCGSVPAWSGVVRRALVVGGYTTREAVARASDADLLNLKRMTPKRLEAVRTVIPHAEEARPAADGGGADGDYHRAPQRRQHHPGRDRLP